MDYMKKWLVFLLGIVAGFILTVVILSIIGFAISSNTNSGIFTMAEQQVEFTMSDRFEVFQVLDNGAMAHCEEREFSTSFFMGPVVYIVADGQNLFYNEQIIEVPKGKKPMQIGTYRYKNRLGENVIPVIKFK